MSTSTDESDVEFLELNTAEIAAVLTCHICHELYEDATAITECLHTFCRQCIYRKLSEAGACRCPECNVYLGSAPLDRLKRHEFCNSLKDLVFPKEGGLNGSTSSVTIHTEVASSPIVPPEGASPVSPEQGVVTPSEPNKETVKTNGVKPTETEASTVGDTSFSSEAMEEEEEDDSEEAFSTCSTSSETSNKPQE